MLPIEDNFEDVLAKAMSGLALNKTDLAKATGIESVHIEALLQGAIHEEALLAVAPALGLSPTKLLDMAHKRWRPSVRLPDWVALHNTPYPVPGYEAMTTNSYLIWNSDEAAAIDTGAKADSLLAEVAQRKLRLKTLFITHTHRDHIAALAEIRTAHPELTVYSPAGEPLPDTRTLCANEQLAIGSLRIETRKTAGHSPGALSYVVTSNGKSVAFVGDAIFCLSMGKAPGAYEKALADNRSQLLTLPVETILCPGHGPATTVGDEKAHNPFF